MLRDSISFRRIRRRWLVIAKESRTHKVYIHPLSASTALKKLETAYFKGKTVLRDVRRCVLGLWGSALFCYYNTYGNFIDTVAFSVNYPTEAGESALVIKKNISGFSAKKTSELNDSLTFNVRFTFHIAQILSAYLHCYYMH